jgi:predicted nucleic acid-binding protein
MVSVDTSVLSLMLHPDAKPPKDPSTGRPIVRLREKLDKMIQDLDSADERIVLSTVALCEFLILAGADAAQYHAQLSHMRSILICPFDERAAIELASLAGLAKKKGAKRAPASVDAPWQKVKFDRQIVVIAKVNQAHTIYADDPDIRKIAQGLGVKVISTWELPDPPSGTPLLDTTTEPPIDL